VTFYDFEDLIVDLEDGVVPSDLGERAAGPLYPLLTRRQLVRVVADQLYCLGGPPDIPAYVTRFPRRACLPSTSS
jgi:hypothetical protein